MSASPPSNNPPNRDPPRPSSPSPQSMYRRYLRGLEQELGELVALATNEAQSAVDPSIPFGEREDHANLAFATARQAKRVWDYLAHALAGLVGMAGGQLQSSKVNFFSFFRTLSK